MIINSERYKYGRNGGKTKTGRAAVDNGDALAEALRGLSIDDVFAAVKANGEKVPEKWQDLNPGMQRMVASNVLRGILRRTGTVTVKGTIIRK